MTIEIDGLGPVIEAWIEASDRIRPDAERIVVKHAGMTANQMRHQVRRRSGRTADSVTADPSATPDGAYKVYAEAGPEWFVGRFLEYGTSRQPPFSFMDESVDEPAFIDGIVGLLRDL